MAESYTLPCCFNGRFFQRLSTFSSINLSFLILLNAQNLKNSSSSVLIPFHGKIISLSLWLQWTIFSTLSTLSTIYLPFFMYCENDAVYIKGTNIFPLSSLYGRIIYFFLWLQWTIFLVPCLAFKPSFFPTSYWLKMMRKLKSHHHYLLFPS